MESKRLFEEGTPVKYDKDTFSEIDGIYHFDEEDKTHYIRKNGMQMPFNDRPVNNPVDNPVDNIIKI